MEAFVIVLLAGCATAYLYWRWKERRIGGFADRLCPHCRRVIRASAAVCPHCSERLGDPRRSASSAPGPDAPAPGGARGPDVGQGSAGAAFAAGALAGALWPRQDADAETSGRGGLHGIDDELLDADDLADEDDADVLFMRHLGEVDELHDAGDHDHFAWKEEEDEDDVDDGADDRFDHDLLDEEVEDLDPW